MAQDSDVPKTADKGKGKAVDDGKSEKSVVNGKKEEEQKASAYNDEAMGPGGPQGQADFVSHAGITGAEEELNEEDQQLKNELDMIVERLSVSLLRIITKGKEEFTCLVRRRTRDSNHLPYPFLGGGGGGT